MRIRKEVIREGITAYPHPQTGEIQFLNATPAHIRHWHDSGNAMRAAGLSIPAPLEHRDTPTGHPHTPMTPAEQLLNNAGEVEKFEIGTVNEEGKVKSALFSWVDVKHPGAISGIKNDTIRWTSPYFTTFTDGSGKKWEGVIGHLALTSKPRIVKQLPFQAEFSITPAVVAPSDVNGISLSRAGQLHCKDGIFKPLHPIAFSLWTGAKFALEDMEEKSEKKPKKKPEGKEGGEEGGEKVPGKEIGAEEVGGEKAPAKNKFDPMTGQPVKESLVDPDGDISIWAILPDLLSMVLGVDCPEEEVTAENGPQCLMEMLRTAMQEKLASVEAPKEPLPGKEPEPDNPIIQERQPMYMSLEQAQAIKDPTTKSIALSLIESQKKNKALEQKLFNDAKAIRNKRIAALSKVLSEKVKQDLEKLAAGAQFSLSDDGVVNDPINVWLSILEAQQQLLPTLLKSPSAEFSIERPPTETTDSVSVEQFNAAREAMMAAAGFSEKK